MEIPQQLQRYNQLFKELDDLYYDAAQTLGLSDSAFDILFALYELGDGCLQKDICALSFCSKQTINSSIRKLEREGLLYLKAGKGRNMHIYPTGAGRRLIEEKLLPVAGLEEAAMGALSAEERRTLLDLTQKYVSSLRDQERQWAVAVRQRAKSPPEHKL
ncbi:MAG: winged helix-turn-helix transcriptional regulator [Lawsonibacter sp.]|nr:winged helix-turn-helix transcriptional regulator [Lawsonibacter sp.]